MVKELTDGQLAKQAHRVLTELIRRNRVRMTAAAGVVPVKQVTISREDGKPILVIASA